jgi:acyl-CoA thioesterase
MTVEMSESKVLYEDGTFIDHIGPVRIRTAGAEAQLELVIARQHCNPNGGTHGGILLTLLDLVQGLSVKSALTRPNEVLSGHPTTVQINCNFISAGRLGETLQGRAQVERVTRTMSFAAGRLFVDDRLVATATAVFRNPAPAEQPKAP